MRPSRCALLLACLALATTAWAQQAAPFTMAVAVQSKYSCVVKWTTDLRAEAATAIERAAPQIRTVVLSGAGAAEEARKNGADYLLTIALADPRPNGCEPHMESLGVPPDLTRPGLMHLAWTVEPLSPRARVKLSHERMLRQRVNEKKTADFRQQLALRGVREAVSGALKQMKAKKAF